MTIIMYGPRQIYDADPHNTNHRKLLDIFLKTKLGHADNFLIRINRINSKKSIYLGNSWDITLKFQLLKSF